MPPGALENFFNVDDLETFVRQKSSVKAVRGKSCNASLDESDPENTGQYGDSDKVEDGKSNANDDWPLYSDFFDERPPLQLEIDNVIDVDNDSELASSVGGDDSDNNSDPDSASNPTSLQKFCDSQNEKIAAI